MARTVDQARHRARRLTIIDAALTCFAAEGYDHATTAAICRAAGIGSGTFFHYFPTKLAVLLALLDHGTAETVEWFEAQEGRADAAGVIGDYVRYSADSCADPRVGGFVRAVGAIMTDPDVAAALARDESAVLDGLLPWVGSAQRAGDIRDDQPAERLCQWLMVVLDGFLGRLAASRPFDPAAESDMLQDAVRRLLAP